MPDIHTYDNIHMIRLAVKAVYDKWLAATDGDHRYLRKKRWAEIMHIIDKYNVKKVLEFGSGISTLLFDSFDIAVDSYETDEDFMEFVKEFKPKNVNFHLWDNETVPELGHYDLALVDGILPRNLQIELAIKHAKFVAVDDFVGGYIKRVGHYFDSYYRVDSGESFMAIFRLN